MNNNSIAVIGGDSRQLFAAGFLAQAGYEVSVFANEHGKIPESVNSLNHLSDINTFSIVLLPLPVSKNGKTINTPLSSQEISIKDLMDTITENHTVFYGMGSESFERTLKSRTKKFYDYFTSENLILKNAYLTAEGITGIILEKLPVSLRGLKTAVTGFGRIGGFCCEILKNLGADVTVFTGSPEKILKAEFSGIKGKMNTELLSFAKDFDCIINTVPASVLTAEIIKSTRPECVLIEAASAPYGIDAEACAKYNRQLIKAFSLPGKTAPKSAGIIIAETVKEKFREVK
ncbi:MAG: hypothetical protein IKB08_02715 [Clostridia bacterium]|nr:hypothetical protein [Clostridia bacterium]